MDVPIYVGLFDLRKQVIMIKQKLGAFLSRRRLKRICCAEKISQDIRRKVNCVRLFKG
jgi:hypothetical protein